MRTTAFVAVVFLGALASSLRAQGPFVQAGNAAFGGPVSEYADAVAANSAVRAARAILFSGISDETKISEKDRARKLTYLPSYDHSQLLPVALADAGLIGTILRGSSYVANDGTTIYSEFRVRVNSLVYNASRASIAANSIIEVARAGGAVRMPSGRTYCAAVLRNPYPVQRADISFCLAMRQAGMSLKS